MYGSGESKSRPLLLEHDGTSVIVPRTALLGSRDGSKIYCRQLRSCSSLELRTQSQSIVWLKQNACQGVNIAWSAKDEWRQGNPPGLKRQDGQISFPHFECSPTATRCCLAQTSQKRICWTFIVWYTDSEMSKEMILGPSSKRRKLLYAKENPRRRTPQGLKGRYGKSLSCSVA